MNDNPFLDDSGSRYFELQLNTENINIQVKSNESK